MFEFFSAVILLVWFSAYFFVTTSKSEVLKLIRECEKKTGRKVEFY